MAILKQSKLYWLKWIDTQYLKADPSHVKMRLEWSARQGEGSVETIEPSDVEDSPQGRMTEPAPHSNGARRR
jgi:hypothetical protein